MDSKNLFTTIATCTILVSSIFPGSIQAADLDYNYIEGRYLINADEDDSNLDGDGFRIAGSYRFTKEIFAFGKWEDVDFDRGYDATIIEFGAGYIFPIKPNWDSNFTLSYGSVDLSGPGIDQDESGIILSGGVRGMVTPEIEARAKLTYNDSGADDDTYFTIAGDYFFMPNLSAGLEADLGGDYETLSIGVRYFFK
ncbi:MAG: hypothetical protein KZQ93_13225 [Candidatus Thiodiazotropha sp. (ex Monitilora ramsayi)]|nr:hypothetical protein [Candidatus Thiodiazotropha sp. (ex Monitilora ramsayi)]